MTQKMTYWKETDGIYLGFLNNFPDHWTLGANLEDLKVHLRNLYHEFSKRDLLEIRQEIELELAWNDKTWSNSWSKPAVFSYVMGRSTTSITTLMRESANQFLDIERSIKNSVVDCKRRFAGLSSLKISQPTRWRTTPLEDRMPRISLFWVSPFTCGL